MPARARRIKTCDYSKRVANWQDEVADARLYLTYERKQQKLFYTADFFVPGSDDVLCSDPDYLYSDMSATDPFANSDPATCSLSPAPRYERRLAIKRLLALLHRDVPISDIPVPCCLNPALRLSLLRWTYTVRIRACTLD